MLAGECIYNHPDYFAWADDDGAATVTAPLVESSDDELHAAQAIATCPSGAIAIVGE